MAVLLTRAEFTARVAALRERFPYQFMKRPRDRYAIAPGWCGIVEALCDHIDQELAESEKKKFRWTQIKEKYGTLRAYYKGGPLDLELYGSARASVIAKQRNALHTRVRQHIARAEEASAKTCLFCGEAGTLHNNEGYLVTACAACARQPHWYADEAPGGT